MSGGTWVGIFSVALVIVLILIAVEYIGTTIRNWRNNK